MDGGYLASTSTPLRLRPLSHASPAVPDDGFGCAAVRNPRVPVAIFKVESSTCGQFKQIVRVPFYRNQVIRIGRDTERCHLRFMHPAVSPIHCEIYSVLFDSNEKWPALIYVRDCQSMTGTFVNRELVGQRPLVTAARLVENNDTIEIGPFSLRICKCLSPDKDLLLDALQRKEAEFFQDQFAIKDMVIGHGASAKVYLAIDKKAHRQAVCKVHDLRQIKGCHEPILGRISREMMIWSQLDHPNIIAFYRTFRTDNNMFTFGELATGGDLFSLLEREEIFPEVEIKWIMRQILSALEYLHCKGVAHRDIKLENVLCTTSPQASHRIALADFGCSSVTSLGRMTSNVGTETYQAPEICSSNQSHGLAVDIWAAGILALQLVAGNEVVEMPQKSHNTSDIAHLVEAVNLSRFSSPHGPISQAGMDFILDCLHTDPSKRPTAGEASRHEWLARHGEDLVLFKERETQLAWKPRDILIPAFVDLRTQATGTAFSGSPKEVATAAEKEADTADDSDMGSAEIEIPETQNDTCFEICSMGETSRDDKAQVVERVHESQPRSRWQCHQRASTVELAVNLTPGGFGRHNTTL